MKRQMFYLMIGFLSLGFVACNSDDEGGNGNNPADIPLVEHNNKIVGWGKGRMNTDAYLSLGAGNGAIETFRTVDVNDVETQELVDLVFPGDWGNQGGKMTIAAPSSTGAGGAAYEYCDGWQRKKGTQIAELPGAFDLNSFESVRFASDLQTLHDEYSLYYSDWLMFLGSEIGRSFLVRTYEGRLAVFYITNIQGTYGDKFAKLTFRIKVMPDLD